MGEIGLAGTIFFLPTLVMGATFSHLAQAARGPSGGVGRALCVNTLGASAAPLVFGVLLLTLRIQRQQLHRAQIAGDGKAPCALPIRNRVPRLLPEHTVDTARLEIEQPQAPLDLAPFRPVEPKRHFRLAARRFEHRCRGPALGACLLRTRHGNPLQGPHLARRENRFETRPRTIRRVGRAAARTARPRLRQTDAATADAVITVRPVRLGLLGRSGLDPRVAVVVEVEVTWTTADTTYHQRWQYRGPEHPLTLWSDRPSRIDAEFPRVREALANHIVDELLLVEEVR